MKQNGYRTYFFLIDLYTPLTEDFNFLHMLNAFIFVFEKIIIIIKKKKPQLWK